MIKKENGITLIALAVTIIIMLILAGIGLSILKNTDTVDTSQKIAKSNRADEYAEALELSVLKAQINYATKEIDKDYFAKIKELLEATETFSPDKAIINYINYSDSAIQEQNPTDDKVNAIQIFVEDFMFIIDEDLVIYDGDGHKYEPAKEGIITFAYNKNWTNQSIPITIYKNKELQSDDYHIEYKIGEKGKWIEESTVKVEENCKIYARIVDNNRTVVKNTNTEQEITNIEKNPPSIKNFDVNAKEQDCLTAVATCKVQDTQSGISKIIYYYSNDGGNSFSKIEQEITKDSVTEERIQTREIPLPAGTYVIKAELYDRAGNKSESNTKTITLGHDWDEGTCLAARKCRNCPATYGAALGHDFTSKTQTEAYLKTAATCTKKAVYYYKCSRCNEKGTNTYEIGEPLGHDFTSETKTDTYLKSEAKCTAKAVYYYKCSRCEEKGTNTYETGEPLGHDFTSKTATDTYLKTAATCTAKAVYYYKCSRCDASSKNNTNTTYENGNALGHNFTSKTVTDTYKKSDATCTAKAVYYYKCSRCDVSSKDNTNTTYENGNALGHNFTSKTATDTYLKTAATCTAKAVYYYKCSRCDVSSKDNTNITYENGNALGHDYKYYNSSGTALDATHPTANGTYTYKCSRNCGIGTVTHTIANLTTPVKKDGTTHYTNQCTSTAHSSTYYPATANHSYQYYNSSGTAIGTTHPTANGTYTYKCACGDGEVTHTIANLTTPVKKDNTNHYTRKCTSTAHSSTYYVATAAHSIQYYNSSGTALGTTHPTANGTYTYKCACSYGAVTHTIATLSTPHQNNDTTHYTKQCTSTAHKEDYYLVTANHSYAYYSGTTNKGTTHPTVAGEYTEKCACGKIKATHTITENVPIDGIHHYKYSCTCGTGETEEHTRSGEATNTTPTICTVCNMKLVEIQNVTINGYDVYVYGLDENEVDRVQFPTWTNKNGQDDIQSNWQYSTDARGTYQGNGTWYYRVNVSEHNNEGGTYYTHIYGYKSSTTKVFRNCTITVPSSTWTQNKTTVTNGVTILEVGSKVNGYEANGISDWYVLGAKDGKLLLTTNSNVTTVTLSGKSGFTRGITTLNTTAASYTNSSYADGKARSINVEDINNVTGYNPNLAKYGENTDEEYNNELKFTKSASDNYIYYKGSKTPTTNTKTSFTTLTYWTGTAWKTLNKGESSPKIKNTYYSYYPQTLSMDDSKKTQTSINGSSNAYNLLFANTDGDNTYFLASQFVRTYEKNLLFGIRFARLRFYIWQLVIQLSLE